MVAMTVCFVVDEMEDDLDAKKVVPTVLTLVVLWVVMLDRLKDGGGEFL